MYWAVAVVRRKPVVSRDTVAQGSGGIRHIRGREASGAPANRHGAFQRTGARQSRVVERRDEPFIASELGADLGIELKFARRQRAFKQRERAGAFHVRPLAPIRAARAHPLLLPRELARRYRQSPPALRD